MTEADALDGGEERSARSGALIAIAQLALVAVYALALIGLDAMHFESGVDFALIAGAGCLWLAILAIYWSGLARADDRRSYAMSHLGAPLLLLAPLLVLPNASWPLVLLLLTAYVLELRQTYAGHGFLFSLGLVVFVIVLATGIMSYVEQQDPDSQLDDIGSSAAWTFATLFRLRSSVGDPQTEDGKTLALLVGVCALLAASLFTAQIVTWVTGSSKKREASPAPPELLAEIATLRAAVSRLSDQLGDSEAAQGPPAREGEAGRGPAPS
jgi:hypothetical protein